MSAMRCILVLFLLCLGLGVTGELLRYSSFAGKPYSVDYDHRSLKLNGTRALLLSGSMHYSRSTPGMWPILFAMARDNGLNTIETYVFWNVHEKERGIFDFTGSGDLLAYIKLAAEYNLFINLRVGPFVGGEWYYGGFPLWLKFIPGMVYRAYNPQWMDEMTSFMKYIVALTLPQTAAYGGNVILAQIENEYYGADNKYLQFCGYLSDSLDFGVPWSMCGNYANNTINSCNGNYCDQFIAQLWDRQPDMPPLWTENEGWYDEWGKIPFVRKTTDVAYSVVRWIAFGGSVHNYYMWFGGNNYGTTSAVSVTTAYANDVLVDSLALPHEPKFSFLGELHKLLAKYANVLLGQDPPEPIVLASGFIDLIDFGDIKFITNFNLSIPYNLLLYGESYYLPAETILILDVKRNIIFNTSNTTNSYIPHQVTEVETNLKWLFFTEPVGPTLANPVQSPHAVDQLILSQYGDYAWYSLVADFSFNTDLDITFLSGSGGVAYSLYVNGGLEAVVWDVTITNTPINMTVTLPPYPPGIYQVDILSSSLGLGAVWAGELPSAKVKGLLGLMIGDVDFSMPEGGWTMQGELLGEALQIYDPLHNNLVNWTAASPFTKPLTWYSTQFKTPHIPGTVALDITGLGKGHAYVNGIDIGRYWSLPGDCDDSSCSAPQPPTQQYYHIPPDWLTDNVNTLVLFEEFGAPDISAVKIVIVT